MKTAKPAPDDPRVLAIRRAQEKLRKKPLPDRTSTYQKGSIRQTQGAYAEIEAQAWLQELLKNSGLTVLMQQESEVLDAREVIENSQGGDLEVYEGDEFICSFEVKSSRDRPNASMTWSQLTDSTTSFLLAITTVGPWVCAMKDAQRHAFEIKKFKGGSYWVVPYDKVKRLSAEEIISAIQKIPRVRHTSGCKSDIPF